MNSKGQTHSQQSVFLIDLPVFPKGVVSLGLPLLASYLREHFYVSVLDLNQQDWREVLIAKYLNNVNYVGLKVSSQNYEHAVQLTRTIKQSHPDVSVIWGGELPSLLPEKCLEIADTVVIRRIEGCIREFIEDIQLRNLKKKYEGSTNFDGKHVVPSLDIQLRAGDYYSFMGLPMETSAGCDRFCRFCMVHTMQPGVKYKTAESIGLELKQLEGRFLNVVDYNLGVSTEHLFAVCEEFQRSGIIGWMGEMCLETLDDDAVLKALSSSRCKLIYCGLESLSEEGLKSVNKHRTNNPENYRRIIRKAQSYGVNVASGFIIGLDGTSQKTFDQMMDFYDEVGIEYVKFTFLTYNPGTYFYKVMERSGTYTTDDITRFDGNHLTYLAEGLNEEELYSSSLKFIRKFYGLSNIIRRSVRAHSNWSRRMEFILFNLCYRHAYFSWIQFGVLRPGSTGIRELMDMPFSRPLHIKLSEALLHRVRTRMYMKGSA